MLPCMSMNLDVYGSKDGRRSQEAQRGGPTESRKRAIQLNSMRAIDQLFVMYCGGRRPVSDISGGGSGKHCVRRQ
jgi:hypothetical protein